MNFQNLNFDYVEQQQPLQQFRPIPRTPSSYESQATIRARTSHFAPDPNAHEYYETPGPNSLSPLPTVVHYAPSPPSPSHSTPEYDAIDRYYGPSEIFGPALVPPSEPVLRTSIGPRQHIQHLASHAIARRAQMESQMNTAMLTGFRDELVRSAGVVTPGVDDTPYLMHAIDSLTQDRGTHTTEGSHASDDTITVHKFVPDQGLGYYQHQPFVAEQRLQPPVGYHRPLQPAPAYLQDNHMIYDQLSRPGMPIAPIRPGLMSEMSSVESLWASRPAHKAIQPYQWLALDGSSTTKELGNEKSLYYQPLRFLPWLLRPSSFIMLMILSTIMITLLMFCAIYSQTHRGLVQFSGTIYGGQYFVFRILPQLIAAVFLTYAQCVISAMFRIMPFARLASDSPDDRDGAIFQDMYPRSFLWPHLVGSWGTKLPIFVTWLLNFTLPLQSSLFTVTLVDQTWTWTTVQGVAWTLVVIYIALLVSGVVSFFFWAAVRRNTGLMWDPRSLADVAVMTSDSNVVTDYTGTEVAGSRDRLRFALRRRTGDKLGYWTWKDGRGGFWYALGNSLDDMRSLPAEEDQPHRSSRSAPDSRITSYANRDSDYDAHLFSVRTRYLPWCMSTNQLLWFVITAFILVLAIFVASFVHSSQITRGFLPWLPAGPVAGAFSAADFLYSFLPSLLGVIMYQLFYSLDLCLRILQPWASLSDARGARAERTLLADYAACVPVQSTLHALTNGHWRVAAISALSTLFLLLPVLGGGAFMALTPVDSLEVRMFPNVPAFGFILALLVLYFLALVSLLPSRGSFRLPHAVTCLAEVISFLTNEEMLEDQAFKGCFSKQELLRKMGLGHGTPETQPKWVFGTGSLASMGGDDAIGVRRVRRFTEKRRVRKSQIRRGDRRPA